MNIIRIGSGAIYRHTFTIPCRTPRLLTTQLPNLFYAQPSSAYSGKHAFFQDNILWAGWPSDAGCDADLELQQSFNVAKLNENTTIGSQPVKGIT